MMRSQLVLGILLLLAWAPTFPQARDYQIHRRSMLRQTVYNTGELGRAYDNGSIRSIAGIPSFEWPANSAAFVEGVSYNGHYNSFGAGLFLAGNHKKNLRWTIQCGAFTDNNGNSASVENVYSYPISIQRTENYPVLPSGQLNPAYNPNEAEEIIVSKWATPVGITVTRTSRTWSFPDYDDFIIYEYELQNTGDRLSSAFVGPDVTAADTAKEVIVAWSYALNPSMFGYERQYNRWQEGDMRKEDMYARYDLKRYMTYNHTRDGKPDQKYFGLWSRTGTFGGGLNSPQAVGILPLYYDTEHLGVKGVSTRTYVSSTDANLVWDSDNRMKQPYLNRYENGNLYNSKIVGFLECITTRKTGPYNSSIDSTAFGTYWIGRARPSWTLETRQPVNHIYGFGPYVIPPGEKVRFVIAEVAGFGPGIASDSVYTDHGGGCGGDCAEPEPGLHPVPSWYATMTYPFLSSSKPGSSIGSTYLQNYPLPPYVNSNVISIRDVADRAIQMYLGGPVIKYDTTQFKPENSPPAGNYQATIPFPAPVIRVENTIAASNKITWRSEVEAFSTPRLHAAFSHYRVMKAPHPLGPWTLIDSVGRRDPGYFADSIYTVIDYESNIGESYYYTVVSVDSLGGKSGTTNLSFHRTQAPAAPRMEKVYVAPNPFIVTSRAGGASTAGDINDKIGFFGLPKRATIRIFSYSGQLVATIEHDGDEFSAEWFQVTRNNQMIASGVYFFTVDDDKGNRVHGKFVVIH